MLNEFYKYCNQFYGDNPSVLGIYVSGGQGETEPKLSDTWIGRMEQDATNRKRAQDFYHKTQKKLKPGQIIRAFDCSGLIMYFLQNRKGISDDRTAHGIYTTLCTPIQPEMLYPGDLVFRTNSSGRIVHCGIVVKVGNDFADGNGLASILESRGRDYGVCLTSYRLNSNTWTRFGRLKCLESDIYKAQICDCSKRILSGIIADIDSTKGVL